MFLSELRISNFRCFDGTEHSICFNPGLTVLVGENDSGKSAIMDAIRIVLGTTDFGWNRIEIDDFYNEDTSLEISIICKFSDLTEDEQAAFLECLTYEEQNEKKVAFLYLHWKCRYLSAFKPPRSVSTLSTGKVSNGPSPSAEAKELLRITYLRALRDAYSDMQSGHHSRLSQIMQNVSNLNQGEDEYQEGMDLQNLSLIGIANLSNDLLASHPALKSINEDMTKILSEQMLLKKDTVQTRLAVAGANSRDIQKTISLLEKLDLAVDKNASAMQGKAGLGTSNIMSMACELLLHKEAEIIKRSSFLLIEEPEAHIHAQRQLKLIQSLETESEKKHQQIIITTHSPLLTSVVKLSNIVIVKEGNVYPLADKYTQLENDDYKFLEKYLDATKANLFFARSVIIVEGPGEALLLPTLAKLIGYSLTDFGTSLVDVRSTGLRRYARIFQRSDNQNQLNIKVACVTDRDVMPNCAPGICIDNKYSLDKTSWPEKSARNWRAEADFTDEEALKHEEGIRQKADGQQVKTFVSDYWTLEYDLAFVGLKHNDMQAILIDSLVKVSYARQNWTDKTKEVKDTIEALGTIEEKASHFYSFFTKKKASKADFAQQLAFELEESFSNKGDDLKEILPKYLLDAIEYVTKG
ncbi:ATP-dependent nuclease [Clostridium thermopalmarium]|uniref:Recombination protein F n=1 Tax=Clostridium thermopalmarium DSM 5974 TaxID=1121340 RepID=A0A2T0AZJ8_9CLOT|nr:AAA family ATPase [Clostridium thermopalmarium]PRR76607.1 recombination protein F [Clostridium thermopalmarium DSM 5974]PVZ28280.1 putative ATP-dependent endonuclease of OLD family [Clostridium thermopalmarium DSM 5974]